ncbi:apolipoprotein N-acyltransferase [Desulfurivibrio alkaliphilus]|nr:apolipoprotein N-acyltransferase [Desulfurivibrio alkaliphilus]
MGKISLAALSGLLLFFSSPGSGGHALLAWMALAPLLLAIQQLDWRRAAGLGLLAGVVYHLPLLHWITIVLGDYGGVHPLVAALALGLLVIYMSLYPAVFAALLVTLTGWGGNDNRHRGLVLWAPAVIWVGLDVLRARLFTGFPWQDLGYSQYQLPLLTQVADLGGHHAITFLIVLSSTLLALLVIVQQHRIFGRSAKLTYRGYAALDCLPEPAALLNDYGTSDRQVGTPGERFPYRRTVALPGRWSLALAVLLLISSVAYGSLRLQQFDKILATAPVLETAVVQGNIPQEEKWDQQLRFATVQRYLELSEATAAGPEKPPTLIVWPETALPFYPLEHHLFYDIIDFAAQHGSCLLVGAPHRELDNDRQLQYYNSAMLISPDPAVQQPAGIYRKQHLVPFGEYIPLRRLLPFFAPVVETLGDFTPGPEPALLTCADRKIGTLICFEAIFPRLARQMTAGGAELLVNITNDAWFGLSNAPHQHLSMAALRAVENRRSLARAANTGISVMITPDGRLHQATQLFVPDARHAALPLPAPAGKMNSLFTAGGYLFGLLCLLLLSAGIVRHIYVIKRV